MSLGERTGRVEGRSAGRDMGERARGYGGGYGRRLVRLALSLGLAVACACSLGACTSLGALVPGASHEATLAAGITDHAWEAVPSGGGVFTFDAGAGRYTSWRYPDKVGSDDTDRHDGTYELMLDTDAATFVTEKFGGDGDKALGQLDRLSKAEDSEVHYVILVLHTKSSMIDGVSSHEPRNIIWEGVWYVDQGRLDLVNINSYNEYYFFAEFVPEDERRSPSSRFLDNTLDMLERDDRGTTLAS
ncbi:MAG: hypothetical protein J6D54_07815 [Olsenella sp.]|nr:hypothetical protein [Olsenella sp.]